MVADFKKKQNAFSGQLWLISVGILVVLFIILLLIANFKIYQKRKQLISRIENLEEKVQEAKSKNEQLKEFIENSDDSLYTEKIAREELDLQKPGEKVFSFIKTSQDENKEEGESSKNIIQIWLGIISGWFKN